MSALAFQNRLTPEQLLQMPDAKNYELVDGELVVRHSSIDSSKIAANVMGLLGIECRRTLEADVYATDLGYQCFPADPSRIRKPDGSLVRRERLTDLPGDLGFMPIPADLVVEVVSPNDLAYNVVARVREYQTAGFPLIWVIYPNVRKVSVYSKGSQSPIELTEADDITASPALSEFRCKLSAFFTTDATATPS